jgi:2-(3-amino-3-carboxypropyl)histidine synthase
MEEDRLETNLGPTADNDIVPEAQPETKSPRRRFVGRRTAERRKEESTEQATIDVESGSSLQGKLINYYYSFLSKCS